MTAYMEPQFIDDMNQLSKEKQEQVHISISSLLLGNDSPKGWEQRPVQRIFPGCKMIVSQKDDMAILYRRTDECLLLIRVKDVYYLYEVQLRNDTTDKEDETSSSKAE